MPCVLKQSMPKPFVHGNKKSIFHILSCCFLRLYRKNFVWIGTVERVDDSVFQTGYIVFGGEFLFYDDNISFVKETFLSVFDSVMEKSITIWKAVPKLFLYLKRISMVENQSRLR